MEDRSAGASIREDLQALWSIAWRVFLLGPIMVPVGYAVLVVALASLILPPCYAVICLAAGDYWLAPLVMAGWLLWLRVAPRVLKPVLENWRDDG